MTPTSLASPVPPKILTIAGAKAMKSRLTAPRKTKFSLQEIQTARSARSGSPAPRPWPTIVAAAFESPHAGRIAKRMTRMAITYPASASAPNDDVTRMSPIQLAVPMNVWRVPVAERRTSLAMIAGWTRRCGRRTRSFPRRPASV